MSGGEAYSVERHQASWRRRMALALAICAGLGLSLAGFAVVRTWEQRQTRMEFDHKADARATLIGLEFKAHLQELAALGRFYNGSKFVDRAEFRAFVEPVLARHSSIHAFEWIPRVTAEQRSAHEQTVREDGIEGYRISARQARGGLVPAAGRQEYFPVAYAEPLERNRAVLGFDCGSVPAWRTALERARDSGQATATERIALATEVPQHFGVLVLLPVYRGPTGTVQERRASLMGFAATVVHISEAVEQAICLLKQAAGIDFRVVDQSAHESQRLLHTHVSRSRSEPTHESAVAEDAESSSLRCTNVFTLGGRQWEVVCTPAPAFLATQHRAWGSWALLATGLVLTALLTVYLLALQGRTRRVETLVNERTAALRKSEERFRQVAESSAEWIWEVDAEGRYTYCSSVVKDMLGHDPEELIGKHFWELCEPETREELATRGKEIIANRQAFHKQLNTVVHKNGEVLTVETTALPILDDAGNLLGYRGVDVDVTDRKRAEEVAAARTVELEQQTAQLEQSRRTAMGMMEDAEAARKQAETAREELRDNEERLQAILDTIQAGVVVIDEEGHTIVDANPAALAMIGAPKEDVVGRVCHKYICPAEAGRCPISDLGQECDSSERVLVRADGQTIPVLKTVTPVMLNGRRHLLDSFVDISELKRAEEALAKSEQKFMDIFYSSADATLLIDGETFVDCNERTVEMLRASNKKEVLATHPSELSPETQPDGRPSFEKANEMIAAAYERGSNRFEWDHRRLDGEVFSVEVTLMPIPLFGKQVLYCMWKDISELVEARTAAELAEEELRESNAMMVDALEREKRAAMELEATMEQLEAATRDAEAATRSKSEFLANMSHEIRTPMTAILGFADVLLEHGNIQDAPPERLAAAQTIKRNGSHLLQIINDILDISKIEAGKLEVERIRCSPIQVVADVRSLMQVRADAKGLPLEIEYEGTVPETIQSDPTRLKQILVNLIGNALKFTETGGVRLVTQFVADSRTQGLKRSSGSGESPSTTLESSAPRPLGPFLQFDVIDTGLGMTPEQMGRLFQAFSQADSSTTRKFGGTGLGLMISKRLSEMLGGTITVESKLGAGSTFRVTVAAGSLDGVKMIEDPLSATVLDSEGAAGFSPRGAAQAEACGSSKLGCRVLLAEDGPDNQRLIAHFLKKAGAEVTVKENGTLAADAALAARDEGKPFDVILMDMQMPVMDGYEATSLLRQEGYTGVIVALTAHAMAGDRQKCLDAGCDDYASKPINRQNLIETVRRHLGTPAIAETSA